LVGQHRVELVVAHVEVLQQVHVPDAHGNGSLQRVVRHVEVPEIREQSQVARQVAAQAYAVKVDAGNDVIFIAAESGPLIPTRACSGNLIAVTTPLLVRRNGANISGCQKPAQYNFVQAYKTGSTQEKAPTSESQHSQPHFKSKNIKPYLLAWKWVTPRAGTWASWTEAHWCQLACEWEWPRWAPESA
jgi:hypothetical protein